VPVYFHARGTRSRAIRLNCSLEPRKIYEDVRVLHPGNGVSAHGYIPRGGHINGAPVAIAVACIADDAAELILASRYPCSRSVAEVLCVESILADISCDIAVGGESAATDSFRGRCIAIGKGDVGLVGSKGSPTPNVDELVSEGRIPVLLAIWRL
jgi:hypothetical protein